MQTEIVHGYWIKRDRFRNAEYNTDPEHLDGERLPHGVQLIFDAGPQYSVEKYLPRWHHDKAVELLEDSYEALLDYFDNRARETAALADGGHQIETPTQDEVWFWYDPTADMILQEEVEPYEVVGLFETESDADRFIREYGKQYGLDDLSHLEKYRADLSYEGQGPILEAEEEPEPNEEAEQAGFDEFLS